MSTRSKKEEMRELAEELAYVEDSIRLMEKYSRRNPLSDVSKGIVNHGKKAPVNAMKKWLIISGVGVVIFPPLTIYGLYRAYSENKRYQVQMEEWNKECSDLEALTAHVTDLEAKRDGLIEKLEAICKAEPSLDGNYWWKAGLNPAFDFNLLPGRQLNWQFVLLNHHWLSEKAGGLYLEDMQTFSISIPFEDGKKLVDSGDYAIVYKNDDLMRKNEKGFVYTHLYAYYLEEVQEVTKSTTRTAIDKELERQAYRQRLDQQEILLNAVSRKALMTNEELNMTGRSSAEEYMQDSLVRGMLEADAEAKLSARGDYEEHTTYSKGFHGLYKVTLYNCADVLVSRKDNDEPICAAILVPRESQKIVQMYVRAAKRDNPLCGRIEPYGREPGYQELEPEGEKIGPSIQMAVDHLLDAADAKILEIKNRDVLAEQPKDLDKYEFAYLIWKDNRRSRKANA